MEKICKLRNNKIKRNMEGKEIIEDFMSFMMGSQKKLSEKYVDDENTKIYFDTIKSICNSAGLKIRDSSSEEEYSNFCKKCVKLFFGVIDDNIIYAKEKVSNNKEDINDILDDKKYLDDILNDECISDKDLEDIFI